MTQCKNCKNNVFLTSVKFCPACGVTLCLPCAEQTKNICPYCYTELEFM